MTRWRYVLIALLVVLLAADLGYRAWTHRPYSVTAWQLHSDGASINYTLPGGGIAEWQFTGLSEKNGQWISDCINRVEVGKPIPDCVRHAPLHK